MSAVLDTHVLLHWVWEDDRLSERQREVIDTASPQTPLLVSDISLWEIAILHSLGRIEMERPLRDFLEQATAPPLVRRWGISPAVAARVAALPATFHRDPADRVIVATAQLTGATLLTSDQRIIEAELVPTVG